MEVAVVDKIGDLSEYDLERYHEDAVANAFSMNNVEPRIEVSYRSTQGN